MHPNQIRSAVVLACLTLAAACAEPTTSAVLSTHDFADAATRAPIAWVETVMPRIGDCDDQSDGWSPQAINDAGIVVGLGCIWQPKQGGGTFTAWHAFQFDGAVTSLISNGQPESWYDGHRLYARDNNDVGQVVGQEAANDVFYPVLVENGTSIPITGGMYLPTAINNLGQVIGNNGVGNNSYLWQAGSSIDLHFVAAAINDRGRIVGNSGGHVMLWKDGQVTDLGPGVVRDINNSNQVVGTFNGAPAIWEYGTIRPLPAGFQPSKINDNGHILGMYNGRITIWDRGALVDPGIGAPAPLFAWRFNDKLQIVSTLDRRLWNPVY